MVVSGGKRVKYHKQEDSFSFEEADMKYVYMDVVPDKCTK